MVSRKHSQIRAGEEHAREKTQCVQEVPGQRCMRDRKGSIYVAAVGECQGQKGSERAWAAAVRALAPAE